VFAGEEERMSQGAYVCDVRMEPGDMSPDGERGVRGCNDSRDQGWGIVVWKAMLVGGRVCKLRVVVYAEGREALSVLWKVQEGTVWKTGRAGLGGLRHRRREHRRGSQTIGMARDERRLWMLAEEGIFGKARCLIGLDVRLVARSGVM
jgi:hypothetical protein